MKNILKKLSLSLFIFLILSQVNFVNAYESGIHYYLTFILANYCGLGVDGDTVALADYSVDRFSDTDAGSHFDEWLDPSKEDTRRIFHFAVDKDMSAFNTVVRGSSWAWETISIAMSEATPSSINPIALGIGMHTLQDSYAHEGFTPLLGHWTQDPDLPKTDVPKLIEAAQSTLTAMDAWSQKVYGHGCMNSFSSIEDQVKAWASLELDSDSDIQSVWHGIAESFTGKTINLEKFYNDPNFLGDFDETSEHIRELKE